MEGHVVDCISDALFRVTLYIRIRLQGDRLVDSMKNIFSIHLDEIEEVSLNSAVVTSDRGYGREEIMEILRSCGVTSFLLIPDNLIRCHPFVGSSYLTVGLDRNKWEIAEMWFGTLMEMLRMTPSSLIMKEVMDMHVNSKNRLGLDNTVLLSHLRFVNRMVIVIAKF